MKYKVVVAGTVITRTSSKEETQTLLEQAIHSFLNLVHPVDTFYIRETSK